MKKEGVVESPPSRENAAGLATRHPRDLSKAESDRVGGWAGHPSASLRAGFREKREKWRTLHRILHSSRCMQLE